MHVPKGKERLGWSGALVRGILRYPVIFNGVMIESERTLENYLLFIYAWGM